MKTKITTLVLLAFITVKAQTFTNYTIDEIGLEFVLSDIIVTANNNYWVTSWASDNGPGIASYDGAIWETYTIDDGTSFNKYRGLFQSSTGALYVGMFIANDVIGGFDVFDGTTWTTYDPFEGAGFNFGTGVSDFAEAANGDIWMLTNKGIAKFDGTNFETYAEDAGVVFSGVAITVTSDDLVWVSTDQGVSSFDGTSFTHYTTDDVLVTGDIFAIEEDGNGNIWFGGFGDEETISFYDGTTFTSFTEFSDSIRKIYVTDDGVVYFGGWSEGVAIYNGTDWTFITEEDGLLDNRIRGIAEDADGNIVFSAWSGVSFYNPTLGIISQFRPDFTVSPNPAADIITINANGFKMETLRMYNVLGSLVKKQEISATTTTVSIHDLNAGIYLMHFSNAQGESVIKKVVKK